MQPPAAFPCYCPTCGAKVSITLALCGQRQLEAVLLQANRLGVEIACRQCGNTFVYSRIESTARLGRPPEGPHLSRMNSTPATSSSLETSAVP